MINILDSNEFIDFLTEKTELLSVLNDDSLSIYINDLIIREVLRNVRESQKKGFYNLIFGYNLIFYDQKLPLETLEKYKNLGLKKGDIAIASFCEVMEADYLITENRHFLKSKKLEKVEVLSLRRFLNKLK